MNLKKRTMDEMITNFNDVVTEMNISRKDKMTLLGMITAIGYEAQNAADVVPVRHGRWVEVEVKELAYYKMMIASMRCDQCERYHNEVYHYGNPTEMAKYCGFCGARMDKDGDGE